MPTRRSPLEGTGSYRLRRWPLSLSSLVVACLAGAACVGPARTFGVFEAKATSSIETARSAVQTARAAAEQAVRDENFGPYLAVTAADADSDANTAQDHFASIQPPDAASDRLRAATLRLLTRAVDVVERARIALRRGDVAALRELIPELAAAATAMEGFVEQHG